MRTLYILLTLALGTAIAGSGRGDPRKLGRGVAASAGERRLIVTFDPSIQAADARRLLKEAGVQVVENPDLLKTDWLIEANEPSVARLGELTEVVRVLLASDEIAGAVPVQGCPGGFTDEAHIAEYRAGIGNGWDGAGNGAADLTWSAERIHSSVDAATATDVIRRALAEWSRHARIRFRYTSQSEAYRNLDFVFAPGDHGDGYPFDGKGRTLAHAYYPAGSTPEPLAGDVHFDADETWSDGGSPDLYSAALHEIGHALGLSHSDQPGAVMYPYYRSLRELQPDDVSALRALYGSDEALTLTIIAPPASTTASAISLAGTVSGGSPLVSVTWSTAMANGTAEGGRTWRIPALPLVAGENRITLTALDSDGRTVSRSISIQRNEGPDPGMTSVSTDNSMPVITISSPAPASYSTSAAQIRIAGTARDNIGIREITWQCGALSGTPSGTTAWSFTLPLLKGENNLIVRARDDSGNVSWRTRSITRR